MFCRYLFGLLFLAASWNIALAAESDSEEVRKWRDMVLRPHSEVTPNKPLGLKYQVEELRKLLQQRDNEIASLTKMLAALKEPKEDEVGKSNGRESAYRQAIQALQARNAELIRSEREAVAAMQTAQRELLVARNKTNRTDAAGPDLQRERVNALERVANLENKVKSDALIRKQLEARCAALSQKLANSLRQLHEAGIEPARVGPRVIGNVLAIKDDYVQISAGSSGGLKKGDVVEVRHPNGSPVGPAELTHVTADKSAARLLADSNKDLPKLGDHVLKSD